jgi:GNAT superfamily N-acetyltransferase
VKLREFAAGDEDAVAALLDDAMDPLYVQQLHPLHGAALDDGPRWRRTLLAESGGRVVGAVTGATNRIHPGRYTLAVEVVADRRGEGIGRRLVEAARELRPRPLPYGTKMWPDDPAASALLAAVGGRPFQTCPCPRLDPRDPSIVDWCAARPVPAGVEFGTADALSEDERIACWVGMYEWVHEPWAPADVAALREFTPKALAAADLPRSVVASRAGRVSAIVWAFPEPTTIGLGTETIDPDEPDGAAILAAALARSLRTLADSDLDLADPVVLDGHDSDPHLAPVVATLPGGPWRPLWLVEL